ncbi:MAG: class B sortase [Clostridia bacterium]|nr:class B sortase [Clostridia bacterium]
MSKNTSDESKKLSHCESADINESVSETEACDSVINNTDGSETDDTVQSEMSTESAAYTGDGADSESVSSELDAAYGDAEPVLNVAEKDIFLSSLETLSADELAPPPEKKRSGRDVARGIIRYMAMFVCAFVFIMSAKSLVQTLFDYKRGDEIYGDIAENIFDVDLSEHAVAPSAKLPQSPALLDYYTALSSDMSDTVITETAQHNVKFEQIKANLNYLKSVNPDIYGYIYIDGTNISFPIVQGDDNDYYLDRAWNGDYLVVGSIFADCYVDRNIENNRNTVLYGHNMLDGNMFNNVMLFFDKEVFDSKVIEVYTFDGIYTFKPFSVFETLATYQYFRTYFTSDEDFLSFCEEMLKKSEVESEAEFTADDQILTLSTCVETGHPLYGIGRYALHAKLVKVEK